MAEIVTCVKFSCKHEIALIYLDAGQVAKLFAESGKSCHDYCMTTAEKVRKDDWIPADTLAARVVVIRNALSLSRREFSQLTGITEGALQGIEEGRSPHKLQQKIQAIHAATGVDRDWLMWGGALRSSDLTA